MRLHFNRKLIISVDKQTLLTGVLMKTISNGWLGDCVTEEKAKPSQFVIPDCFQNQTYLRHLSDQMLPWKTGNYHPALAKMGYSLTENKIDLINKCQFNSYLQCPKNWEQETLHRPSLIERRFALSLISPTAWNFTPYSLSLLTGQFIYTLTPI